MMFRIKAVLAFATLSCLSAVAIAAPQPKQAPARNQSASPAADPLITRCEALKRQSDRSVCISEVIRAATGTAAQSANANPAAPVLRPSARDMALSRSQDVFANANALNSVIKVGVSLGDYDAYLQRLAIALDNYRANIIQKEESVAAELFGDALEAYTDARRFWQADLRFFASPNARQSYAGLPVGAAGVSDLVSKYYLPLVNVDSFGVYQGISRSAALPKMWEVAATKISAARVSLNGIGAGDQARSAGFRYASTVTAELKTRAAPAFDAARCTPAGELRLGSPLVEQDVVIASCKDGREQSVACSASVCTAVNAVDLKLTL